MFSLFTIFHVYEVVAGIKQVHTCGVMYIYTEDNVSKNALGCIQCNISQLHTFHFVPFQETWDLGIHHQSFDFQPTLKIVQFAFCGPSQFGGEGTGCRSILKDFVWRLSASHSIMHIMGTILSTKIREMVKCQWMSPVNA